MIFIETSRFSTLIDEHLTEEEQIAFQWYLLGKPDAGAIVSGSGGVRKVRWSQGSKGKRGGVRIIYYWRVSEDEIWLLTLYSKNERATIPGHVLKKIAEEIEGPSRLVWV